MTEHQIYLGIKKGIIKFVTDPYLGSGTVCQIKENWFYFGGVLGEELSPEEYVKEVPEEDIVREIYDTLNDFKNFPELRDEYKYYDCVLNEELKKERENISMETSQQEWNYILDFVESSDFAADMYEMQQLRCLWTSFCIRRNIIVDTSAYDGLMIEMWNVMQENITSPYSSLGYERFYNAMCKLLV